MLRVIEFGKLGQEISGDKQKNLPLFNFEVSCIKRQ